jgi:tRNA threonylcarbamoyladenosine biosynthesis protein TsaB
MILGIETATSRLGVALYDGSSVLASMQFSRGNAHDELLSPLCRDIVAHAGFTMSDLTAVAVSAGPGSFTGLRIGMAAAKGFSLGLDIPLIAVPTLDAAAEHVAGRWPHVTGTALAVCIDAKRDDVYAATYDLQGHTWRTREAVRVTDSAALLGHLPEGTMLCGDGAAKVQMLAPDRLLLLPDPASVFDARAVASLGARLLAEVGPSDADHCEPLYVQQFQVKQAKNLLL